MQASDPSSQAVDFPNDGIRQRTTEVSITPPRTVPLCGDPWLSPRLLLPLDSMVRSSLPNMECQVRPARAGDAEAMLRAHHEAVRQTAGPYYSADVIEAWEAKLTEKSVESLRREIADEGMIVLVADVDSQVVGFGMIVPGGEELRAVYVHPAHGRRSVGTAILKRLEEMAIERGVEHLNLESSINAEAFYAQHGYMVIGRTLHRLSSGPEMACVKMTKQIV
jgi:putative acetyltransferase